MRCDNKKLQTKEIKNAKKKILFIIWSFTYGGGAEKILANLVNKMDLDKYDIDIIEYWHVNTQTEKVDDRINILKPIVDATKASKFEKLSKKILLEHFPNVLRNKYINKEYDYEIAFNYMIPTFLLSKKCKTISWMHGDIYDLKENKKNRKLQKRSLRHVNKIVAISENTYNSIIDVFPEFKDKTCVINNSFDIETLEKKSKEKIDIKKNKFTMLFAGRFDENKNPLFLINVAKILKEKNIDFDLLMIGIGDLKEKVEKKIEEYGLKENVKILGYQKNPYPYFKMTDIVLLSSKSEGFPTVLAESLIFGKPFVSTKVGGTSELSCNGKCGFVTNDIEEYAEDIITLINNKKVYDDMSKNGKISIKKFTPEYQLEKIEKLLKDIDN